MLLFFEGFIIVCLVSISYPPSPWRQFSVLDYKEAVIMKLKDVIYIRLKFRSSKSLFRLWELAYCFFIMQQHLYVAVEGQKFNFPLFLIIVDALKFCFGIISYQIPIWIAIECTLYFSEWRFKSFLIRFSFQLSTG